jgi:hypothetical protein
MGKIIKLITCQALAHLIGPIPGSGMARVILPMSLHLSPPSLRKRLNEEIRKTEEPETTILLGYGLCGRGLEGVQSKKSRLGLPKVDDCVGAVLGSRLRHKTLSNANPGCFFMEPSWIGTDIDIFTQIYKGLDRIPEENRDEIVRMAFKNYSRLALICHGNESDLQVISSCRMLAESYGLTFLKFISDLALLKDLANGPWDPDRFIVTDPGQAIPFF